jgi:hypothetical protein
VVWGLLEVPETLVCKAKTIFHNMGHYGPFSFFFSHIPRPFQMLCDLGIQTL